MSNIPNLGKYGYVAPNIPVVAEATISTVSSKSSGKTWKRILITLFLVLLIFGVFKLTFAFTERRKKKKQKSN